MTKTVALIVGTRPEAIKMAPVFFALRDHGRVRPLLVSSGQHRQMLDQALQVFGLKPEVELDLMTPDQTLPELTGKVLNGLTRVFREHRPAAVLAQGDTTTVLSAALAAFYERIPLGHVEAGLRTYDFEAPWPEEMNRRLADTISRWCFAPTQWSRANLLKDNVAEDRVHVTGNTVIDALQWVRTRLETRLSPRDAAERCGIPETFFREHLVPGGNPFVLITGHRRESFGEGFENIC